MKINEVRKAASDNAEKISNVAYSGGGHIGQDDLETAFENGADWRINSVWHGIEKLPDVGKLIIVDVASDYDLCYCEDCQVWKSARKWAYIEDLIPNKED